MTQEKLLDKLAKLKRHAESAKAIGNEAEAEAFAAMFQRLVMDHNLALTDLEFTEQVVDVPVESKLVNWHEHGIKPKRRRAAWAESLAAVVAQAHFCRILVHPGTNYITLVGRPNDIAIAEYAYVTLFRAAEKLAKRAYYKYWFELFEICAVCGKAKEGHREAHEFESSTYKAGGFRASWLDAFVTRLAQRYREIKQGYTGESMALIRVEKTEKAVLDFVEKVSKGKATGLSRNRRFNAEGAAQGRAAADKLNLTTKAVLADAKLGG